MYYNNLRYKSSNPKVRLMLLGGIPNITKWEYLDIRYDKEFLYLDRFEKLKIFGKNTIKETYKIPHDRIITMEVMTHEEVKVKEKSVIKRGLVGGLVFGPAGMILGGMSGIGSTTQVRSTPYFIIAYSGENEEEIKNLVFWCENERFAMICKLFAAEYNANLAPKPKLITSDENGELLL